MKVLQFAAATATECGCLRLFGITCGSVRLGAGSCDGAAGAVAGAMRPRAARRD